MANVEHPAGCIGCLCSNNNLLASPTCPKPFANGFDCDAGQKQVIVQYGVDFLAALAPVLSQPQNGAFITSCICHAG